MGQESKNTFSQIVEKVFVNKPIINRILSNSRIDFYDIGLRKLMIKTDATYISTMLKSNIEKISQYYIQLTKKPIDEIQINNETVYTDKRTLEDIVSNEQNLPIKEVSNMITTIEKTVEENLLKDNRVNKSHVELQFWNESKGKMLTLRYYKGDNKYRNDISLGLTFIIIFIGIPYIVKGYFKKTRILMLKREIKKLISIKYKPANNRTKKMIKAINQI